MSRGKKYEILIKLHWLFESKKWNYYYLFTQVPEIKNNNTNKY